MKQLPLNLLHPGCCWKGHIKRFFILEFMKYLLNCLLCEISCVLFHKTNFDILRLLKGCGIWVPCLISNYQNPHRVDAAFCFSFQSVVSEIDPILVILHLGTIISFATSNIFVEDKWRWCRRSWSLAYQYDGGVAWHWIKTLGVMTNIYWKWRGWCKKRIHDKNLVTKMAILQGIILILGMYTIVFVPSMKPLAKFINV